MENAFRKTATGFLASGLVSLVSGMCNIFAILHIFLIGSFKTKLALVMLGTGIGMGMGYAECRVSFERNIHFQKRYYAFVDVKDREPLAAVEPAKEKL